LTGDHYRSVVFAALDAIYRVTPITEVISGGAAGPDTFADLWAHWRRIPSRVIRPDWDAHGKRAALLRDDQIVASADRLLAFWDGHSHGTAYTIRAARAAGLPIDAQTFHLLPVIETEDGHRVAHVLIDASFSRGLDGTRRLANLNDLTHLSQGQTALTLGDVLVTTKVKRMFGTFDIQTRRYSVLRTRGGLRKTNGKTVDLSSRMVLIDAMGIDRTLHDILLDIRQTSRKNADPKHETPEDRARDARMQWHYDDRIADATLIPHYANKIAEVRVLVQKHSLHDIPRRCIWQRRSHIHVIFRKGIQRFLQHPGLRSSIPDPLGDRAQNRPDSRRLASRKLQQSPLHGSTRGSKVGDDLRHRIRRRGVRDVL